MRKRIFISLRCLQCKNSFEVSHINTAKDRITNAHLFCDKCNKHYYIVNGLGLFNQETDASMMAMLKKQAVSKSKLLYGINEINEYSLGYPEELKRANDLARRILYRKINNVYRIKGPIIDICTGAGTFLCYLASFRKWDIIAVDNNLKQNLFLESLLCKKNIYRQVSIVNADAINLPFIDKYSDCVISHLGVNEYDILKEISRILVNNGFLIFTHIITEKNTKTYEAMLDRGMRPLISISQIKKSLQQLGLKLISIETIISSFLPGLSDEEIIMKNDPFQGLMITAQKRYSRKKKALHG